MNSSNCITVKVLSFQENLVFTLDRDTLVGDLKIETANKLRCCANQIILVCCGNILKDDYTCQEQCIKNGQTIHCLMKDSCSDPYQNWLNYLISIPSANSFEMQKFICTLIASKPKAIKCFLHNLGRILSQPDNYCLCDIMRSSPVTQCLMSNEPSLAELFKLSSMLKNKSGGKEKRHLKNSQKSKKKKSNFSRKYKESEHSHSSETISIKDESGSSTEIVSDVISDISSESFTENDFTSDCSLSESFEDQSPCICEAKNKGISNALIMQKLAQHLSCNPTLLQEFLCIPNVRKVMQCMCECYNSLKNQENARICNIDLQGCGKEIMEMLEHREVRKIYPCQSSSESDQSDSSIDLSFKKKPKRNRGRSRKRESGKSSRTKSKVRFSDSTQECSKPESRLSSAKRSASQTSTRTYRSRSKNRSQTRIDRRAASEKSLSSKASFCPFLEPCPKNPILIRCVSHTTDCRSDSPERLCSESNRGSKMSFSSRPGSAQRQSCSIQSARKQKSRPSADSCQSHQVKVAPCRSLNGRECLLDAIMNPSQLNKPSRCRFKPMPPCQVPIKRSQSCPFQPKRETFVFRSYSRSPRRPSTNRQCGLMPRNQPKCPVRKVKSIEVESQSDCESDKSSSRIKIRRVRKCVRESRSASSNRSCPAADLARFSNNKVCRARSSRTRSPCVRRYRTKSTSVSCVRRHSPSPSSSSRTLYSDERGPSMSENSRSQSRERLSDSASARSVSRDSQQQQQTIDRAMKTAATGALHASPSKEKMATSFEPQLKRMSRMGYNDRKANIEALIETDGYVKDATKLLSKPPRY